MVALGGIIGTSIGLPMLDPIAGMAVACMIIKVGGDISLDRFVKNTRDVSSSNNFIQCSRAHRQKR